MTGNKENRYSELFKNTGLLAIGNFSSKILVFLMVPLYTNVLTTAEYGLYDIFITTAQLLLPFFSLNVTDGVLRFVLESDNNVNQVFRIALRFILLSLIPTILILVVNQIVGYSAELNVYGVYVLAYYISYSFNQFFIQFAKSINQVSKMTISGVIGTVVTVAVCIISLLVLNLGLKGFFCANILGQFLPSLYLFISLKLWSYIDREVVIDRILQKRLLAYTIPLTMTTVGWWLNNTSDKYIITAMKGIEINGLLSVAYKIPSILAILHGIFIQAWQISAMKEFGKADSILFYNKVFVALNIFVYFSASILIVLTRPLAYIAFSNEFYNAWIFVPYLLMGTVFTASAGFIAPILTSAYKTWAVAKSTIIGGVINIVLNIVFLYVLGNIGVAVATLLSSFVILFVRYKDSSGVITKDSFNNCLVLWGLLCLQATLGVLKLELLQIPCVIAASYLFRYDILKIFHSISSFLRK